MTLEKLLTYFTQIPNNDNTAWDYYWLNTGYSAILDGEKITDIDAAQDGKMVCAIIGGDYMVLATDQVERIEVFKMVKMS